MVFKRLTTVFSMPVIALYVVFAVIFLRPYQAPRVEICAVFEKLPVMLTHDCG